MRIWSGYTKFLRSQCNKDRVIDSLYFGTFFRKETGEADGNDEKGTAGNSYACIHDPKSQNNQYLEFKSTNNSENFESIPQIVSQIPTYKLYINFLLNLKCCLFDQYFYLF